MLDAFSSDLSKPTNVAVTVITTNGVPSIVWAMIRPKSVPAIFINE